MIKILVSKLFFLGVILTAGIIALYAVGPTFIEIMELKALDLRFIARGKIKPGPEVVLAVIDEKSVDKIGRWPWPRSKIGRLVRALNRDNAKVIAFDIGFFEPDKNTNITLIEKLEREIGRLKVKNKRLEQVLEKERALADNDLILAQAIEKASTPTVLGYFFHTAKGKSLAHISKKQVKAKVASLIKARYSFTRLSSPDARLKKGIITPGYMPEANIPLLARAAGGAGYFNMFSEIDGTVRWVPMTILCRGKFYLPLSLQALRFYQGDAGSSLTISEVGIEHVSVGNYDLPTDEAGRFLVNFRGPSKTFPHYSVADILARRLKRGTFRNKIVLVGHTTVGTFDFRVTPFDRDFPGIEVHANILDNILHRDFLLRPQWTAIFDLISIIFIGLFLGLLLPRLSAFTAPVLSLGLLLAWVGGNYFLFTKGWWVNIVYPGLTLVLVYTGITVFRYITEEREKKKIKGAFSHYVNPALVAAMLKNPDMLKLGGDKRIMTVLFSDIRGFTTISEKMAPEALVQLLNRYLTVMTGLVFKNEGLLDKYIGDAIMAIWGAPLDQPQHALLACRTGLGMMSALKEFREALAAEDPDAPELNIGIGLNTGFMIAGNMGSESRFDYTVMGDAVNLGSRLEGANKLYGTNIIIGEMTFEQVKDEMYCRELDSVTLKGKAQPIRIYELLGEVRIPEEKLKLARAFEMGLAAYKARHWDQAQKVFSAICHKYPDDNPSRLYLERVVAMKQNPPPQDWDGVFVLETK